MGKIASNMPKTVRQWLVKHPSMFVDATYEDGYNEGKAYDILLSRGHCAYGDAGAHTIIEYSARRTLDVLRDVEACGCQDCETGAGW